jgi:amino acid transporter
MALDGWLPARLSHMSKQTGVPTVALAMSSAIAALFALLPFGKLVVIDMLLYATVLALQFTGLIKLRVRSPKTHRPFRIPGGWPAIVFITLSPMACAGVVLVASFGEESGRLNQLWVIAALLLSGSLLYFIRRRDRTQERN